MKIEIQDLGGYQLLYKQWCLLNGRLDKLLDGTMHAGPKDLADLSRAVESIAQQMRQYEQLIKKRFDDMPAGELRDYVAQWFSTWTPADRQAFLDKLSGLHAKLSPNQSAMSSARSPALK